MEHIKSYFRTHRIRTGLSQQELAFLLGLKSGQMVSRYERLDRVPSVQVMLASFILFDALPHELFPGLFKEVEQLTIKRAKMLTATINTKNSSPILLHKRDFLLNVVQKVEARN